MFVVVVFLINKKKKNEKKKKKKKKKKKGIKKKKKKPLIQNYTLRKKGFCHCLRTFLFSIYILKKIEMHYTNIKSNR